MNVRKFIVHHYTFIIVKGDSYVSVVGDRDGRARP